jgi:prevent-host-death family protein
MARKSVHKYAATRRKAPDEVPATAFKDSCLQLIERVQQTREEIVVTKYGRPVAKLVAFQEGKAPIFGFLEGSVTIRADIVAPLDEEWDAQS